MPKLTSIAGSVKGIFSRKRPNRTRHEWPSCAPAFQAESSSHAPWEDREAPPAYTEDTAGAPSPAIRDPPQGSKDSKETPESLKKYSNNEDPYAFLAYFDTIFLIDDSGSMMGKSWREAADVLRTITPICTTHDKDGIDLHFLNHKSKNVAPVGKAQFGYYNIETPQAITAIFNAVGPDGGTPTGTKLWSILYPYVKRLRTEDIIDVKPINIIVITDGAPSDDPGDVIGDFAKQLDQLGTPPHQIGIQFFQVGQEPGAAEALRLLDDRHGQKSSVRDMVDTVTWDENKSNWSSTRTLSADTILKVVLGAVIRRLDHLPSKKSIL